MNGNERTPALLCLRGWLAMVAATAALVAAQSALAYGPTPALVALDIFDRTDGTALAVHLKDGQRYIVGTPGHEYAVRIRNCTGERILAVTSVDGVNVVSGETAAPEQSGYVIDAWGSVEIAGWRKSLERTAAFYFTDLGDSYAARTGRPGNVGVVGVAVFREKRTPIALWPQRDKIASADTAERARADGPMPAPATEAQAGATRNEAANADGMIGRESRALTSKLGTGHGRNETSYAQRVRFERASDTPAETLAIQYDRRENLIAMGVIRGPRYAQRTPDPFPGMRFAPDPR